MASRDIIGFECKTAAHAPILFAQCLSEVLATQMHAINLTEINEIACRSVRKK